MHRKILYSLFSILFSLFPPHPTPHTSYPEPAEGLHPTPHTPFPCLKIAVVPLHKLRHSFELEAKTKDREIAVLAIVATSG